MNVHGLLGRHFKFKFKSQYLDYLIFKFMDDISAVESLATITQI